MSDRSVVRSSRAGTGDSSARDSVKKSRRGGRRPGAGRKPGRFRRPAHRARPALSSKHPVHVTYRLERYVRALRDRDLYHVFRRVLACYLAWPGFRIVHISIQINHLHLIVEAADREALTAGLKSFAIRCAKALHKRCGTSGKLFAFRYHDTQLTSPRQAHNAVTYVLNNWRRHHLDLTPSGTIHWCPVDPVLEWRCLRRLVEASRRALARGLRAVAGLTAADGAPPSARTDRSVRLSRPAVVTFPEALRVPEEENHFAQPAPPFALWISTSRPSREVGARRRWYGHGGRGCRIHPRPCSTPTLTVTAAVRRRTNHRDSYFLRPRPLRSPMPTS
jgi:REP element-mobilizing transposase RayT